MTSTSRWRQPASVSLRSPASGSAAQRTGRCGGTSFAHEQDLAAQTENRREKDGNCRGQREHELHRHGGAELAFDPVTLHHHAISTDPQRGRRLRVLAVTRIFPNRVEPLACAFARQQLASLSRRCDVQVFACIPFLPGASLLGDRTRPGRLCNVPERDEIDGVPVIHPRIPYFPRAGSALAPINLPLYLAGLLPHLDSLRDRFDIVLGSYLYPDACAAAVLANLLGLPYAVKTHGTDVNLVSKWASVQPILRRTLQGAAMAFGVSRPILDRLIELGAPPDRALLVSNGVDRTLFHPRDKGAARAELGLPAERPIVAFVGRLEEAKGVRELLEALAAVRARTTDPAKQPMLVCAGDGAMRAEVERQGTDSVHLVGSRPLPEVATYVAAADVLALPSWAEGTPNVVLEALASARPVVATRVGGIPDVVTHGKSGLLVPPHDAAALADALADALSREWKPEDLAAAAPPSWDESADLLAEALSAAARRRTIDALDAANRWPRPLRTASNARGAGPYARRPAHSATTGTLSRTRA